MNLYLNIEILNREFHSKLFIAMESASRGMNVYLGRLKPFMYQFLITKKFESLVGVKFQILHYNGFFSSKIVV